MKKRFFAIILALTLCAGLVTPAFAEDTESVTVAGITFDAIATVWQNNMCKHYSAENRYRIKKCLNLLEYKSFQHNICMRSTKCEYRYYAGKC